MQYKSFIKRRHKNVALEITCGFMNVKQRDKIFEYVLLSSTVFAATVVL